SAAYTPPVTAAGYNAAQVLVAFPTRRSSELSNAATLTVNAAAVAPSITTQPAGQTVTVGQTATFMVVATGTAPLSYQWQKNGTAIGRATVATQTTTSTASADTASLFHVVVSN